MSTTIQPTTIELFGKSYQIACPSEEIADLEAAVRLIDDKVRNMSHTDTNGHEKQLMLLALNLANDFVQQQRSATVQAAKWQQDCEELTEKINNTLHVG